jgi:hypothetical protein
VYFLATCCEWSYTHTRPTQHLFHSDVNGRVDILHVFLYTLIFKRVQRDLSVKDLIIFFFFIFKRYVPSTILSGRSRFNKKS